MKIEEIKEIVLSIDSNASFKEDKDQRLWISVSPDKLRDVLKSLKDKGYDHLSAISGVDYPQNKKMELLYHLMHSSPRENPYLTIRTEISRDNPEIPSIFDIFAAALIYESEVFDLLGIKFVGHPTLGRLFLPEDTPKDLYPLRKDFKNNVYEVTRK